ncbi:M23 family metallopeptidase [Hymenobacter sp. GOD-10R]|uniref:M23 family metallopeptidase n=1 Tax=Hymenobacter sp. GOD-10R TaxID=3093922 RepID=UPI002D78F3E6|nr:M23 family metallopeptidase [Hymenobacter sp. GOD-10R]WRQ31849.1 M23 family metallopeptidase [Hymenobacter sp. GOD-10R]
MKFYLQAISCLLLIELKGADSVPRALELHVPFAPAVVRIAGQPTLYYELLLTNPTADTLNVQKLRVVSEAHAAVAVLEGAALAARFGRTGQPSTSVLPGAAQVLYLEVELPAEASVKQLGHHLTYTYRQGVQKRVVHSRDAWLPLKQHRAPVLGPPLRGGPWAAVYEPSWERGHRRVRYTIDGQTRIPGRYAIDFIRLDRQGRYARADENVVGNWYGYGADVLAVRDGVVVATQNDFSESPTLAAHPAYSAAQATGNYIALDLGRQQTAFYEHLRPGSLRVRPGQHVKQGQVLAQVGFTGQTTGPHLHFHLADAPSALGAEGAAYSFARFTHLGTYLDFNQFGKRPWTAGGGSQPVLFVEERPAANSVIQFE